MYIYIYINIYIYIYIYYSILKYTCIISYNIIKPVLISNIRSLITYFITLN